MDAVITPEPHFIPGYTGHCPQYRFRSGKTYGKLTHSLLINPCINHAPELILTPMNRQAKIVEYPTQKQIDALEFRAHFIDPIYTHPIVPGYDGFVPNLATKIGKRFIAAATAGVVEHENLMEYYRCKRRHLVHRNLLASGEGLFEAKKGERLMSGTLYRSPLIKVRPRARALEMTGCELKEVREPYSKDTVPHFMDDDDPQKFFINGYAGHVPMAMRRFGQSSQQLTNRALCEFTDNYHHRRLSKWCPLKSLGDGIVCPNEGHFEIYHKEIGVIPHYSGHVPGESFIFGKTYGDSTVDAKGYLAYHRIKKEQSL